MALSKINLEKLRSFVVKKESTLTNKSSKDFINKKASNKKSRQFVSNNPNDIFYEIIDTTDNINDTNILHQKLKKIEDNTLKSNDHISFSSRAQKNVLSDEELLYEEFKDLLEE